MPPRPTGPVSIVYIGLAAPHLELARTAADEAFPDVPAQTIATLAEAVEVYSALGLASPLWVVEQPAPGGLDPAFALGGPRGWSSPVILYFGEAAAEPRARAIGPAQEKPDLVAEIFRSAFSEHQLRRENHRLRGDLQSVATRMTHDLRSPLTPIFANCEMLQIILADAGLQEEEVLRGITTSAYDITRIIERLSAFAKATSMPKPPERVPLGPIIFAARQRLESRLLAAGAVITEPASWPSVVGVPAWIESIWGQWLDNALRHAGPNPRLEFGFEMHGNMVMAWLQDSGPGIPAEKLGRLYQPFDSLHTLNAARGFGLPLVQRLLELQGGLCGHDAPAGGGARFYFILPAAN